MKSKKIEIIEEWREGWKTPKIIVKKTGLVLQEPTLGKPPFIFWNDELNKRQGEEEKCY